MFLGPIMFFAVMLPATAILCMIYKRIEEAIRYTASVVLAGLFLGFVGVPGLIGLTVVAVAFFLAWSTARKDQAIAQERDDFEGEAQPRDVEIGPGFLASFPDPLWSRLDLDDCEALWAIEGEQDGAPYMIIEISHDQFGLMANDHSQATTTFFLATHTRVDCWSAGDMATAWLPCLGRRKVCLPGLAGQTSHAIQLAGDACQHVPHGGRLAATQCRGRAGTCWISTLSCGWRRLCGPGHALCVVAGNGFIIAVGRACSTIRMDRVFGGSCQDGCRCTCWVACSVLAAPATMRYGHAPAGCTHPD